MNGTINITVNGHTVRTKDDIRRLRSLMDFIEPWVEDIDEGKSRTDMQISSPVSQHIGHQAQSPITVPIVEGKSEVVQQKRPPLVFPPPGKRAIDYAKKVLSRMEGISVKRLADEMIAAGWETTASDPANNVKTLLSSHKDVFTKDEFGWKLIQTESNRSLLDSLESGT